MTTDTYAKFVEFQTQRRGETSTSGSTTEYSVTCMVSSRQWMIDSGVSDHMTGDAGMLHNYALMGRVPDIIVANGISLKVYGKRSIRLSSGLSLTLVLHTPGNLFSL